MKKQGQNQELKIPSLVPFSKKAQMKIQQMAVMLLAVTLFFILVGMFILTFKLAGLKESSIALEEKNAMLLVTKVANSPEFSCGRSFGTGKINCIDTDKVMMLKQSSEKYSKFWGNNVANIEIRRIYPANTQKECTLNNYPDCDIIKLYSKDITGNSIWNFVSLCRKELSEEGNTYDKCELGKIFISYIN